MDIYAFNSGQPVLHSWCNKGHGMCCPVGSAIYLLLLLLLLLLIVVVITVIIIIIIIIIII